MTIDERLDRLTGVVESLARSVMHHDDQIEAHDRQIEGLIQVTEEQKKRMDQLIRGWQAYLNTIRPQ